MTENYRRPRPTACPNCGAPCTSHTGSYCQECGEPLVPAPRPTPPPLSEHGEFLRRWHAGETGWPR